MEKCQKKKRIRDNLHVGLKHGMDIKENSMAVAVI